MQLHNRKNPNYSFQVLAPPAGPTNSASTIHLLPAHGSRILPYPLEVSHIALDMDYSLASTEARERFRPSPIRCHAPKTLLCHLRLACRCISGPCNKDLHCCQKGSLSGPPALYSLHPDTACH